MYVYQSVIGKQLVAALPLLCALCVLLSACAGKGRSEWEDIDYSSVYKKASQRENDSGYTSGSFGSCLDDDFGCQ